MPLTRHRALRSHGRFHGFGDVNRRHFVVDAIREQRIVSAMMLHLPAPLRLVVLHFRSIARRVLYLLTAGHLLRLGGHRQRRCCRFCRSDRIGIGTVRKANGRSGFLRGLRGRRSLFRGLLRPQSGASCSSGGINSTSVIVLLVMAIHVVLRGMVVRFVGIFRIPSSFLSVGDEMRSLDHQMATYFLEGTHGTDSCSTKRIKQLSLGLTFRVSSCILISRICCSISRLEIRHSFGSWYTVSEQFTPPCGSTEHFGGNVLRVSDWRACVSCTAQ